VAAQAESHFRIEKTVEGEPALTTVESLEGDEVVEELCRMLGAGSEDEAARQHARDLLAAA
jgi:DNA repair protein RecN (Recombination protein N)